MKSAIILVVIMLLTVIGDYLVKLASQRPNGLMTLQFLFGALLYGLPAFGWFYLMRSHSLSAVAVFYSAATILTLVGLGVLFFDEPFGLREVLGVSLAIAAVLIISH